METNFEVIYFENFIKEMLLMRGAKNTVIYGIIKKCIRPANILLLINLKIFPPETMYVMISFVFATKLKTNLQW